MTKRPSYHDLLRPENDHGPAALDDYRALHKPAKPKATKRRKVKTVTLWAFAEDWINITGKHYRRGNCLSSRRAARELRKACGHGAGPIVRISLPLPKARKT